MYIYDPTSPPPVDDIIKEVFDSKRSRTSPFWPGEHLCAL